MEDGIRNLLAGIGQPEFSYRNFNHLDHKALLEKWPLMALIAEQPAMSSTPFSRAKAGGDRTAPPVRTAPPRESGRPDFLSNYDPAKTRPTEDPAKDVRSLLGRLSEDLR